MSDQPDNRDVRIPLDKALSDAVFSNTALIERKKMQIEGIEESSNEILSRVATTAGHDLRFFIRRQVIREGDTTYMVLTPPPMQMPPQPEPYRKPDASETAKE